MIQTKLNFRRGPIAKICALASGSSGNATFVATEKTRILIDAGVCRREIFQRLESIGESAERLDAVLISHEHSDHVSGLIPLLRKLNIPVYLSRLTAPSIDWNGYMPEKVQTFQAGERFWIGDLQVQTFTIPHDAVDPVGFCVWAEDCKMSFVTDLGYMPQSVKVHLRNSDFLMLESNHDLEMLKVGPYPWPVKQRVMGRNGHLSNDVVCDYILDGLDGCLQTLVLGHLSEHNNHPALVRVSADRALRRRSMAAQLVVADPKTPSEVFQF